MRDTKNAPTVVAYVSYGSSSTLSRPRHGMPLRLLCSGALWSRTAAGAREAQCCGRWSRRPLRDMRKCRGFARSRMLHEAWVDEKQEEGSVVSQLQQRLVWHVGIGGDHSWASMGICHNRGGFSRIQRWAILGDGFWRAGVCFGRRRAGLGISKR